MTHIVSRWMFKVAVKFSIDVFQHIRQRPHFKASYSCYQFCMVDWYCSNNLEISEYEKTSHVFIILVQNIECNCHKTIGVEASWNVMSHAQKPDFIFRWNGPSPFKSGGVSIQLTAGSRGVRISGSNAGYTMFRGSVKGTGYLLHSPVSPSLPLLCFTVCHHISTWVYFLTDCKWMSPFKSAGTSVQLTAGSRGVRISGSNAGYSMFRGSVKGTGYPLHSPVSPSLPLLCVTVCHHISTGVYNQSFHMAAWNVTTHYVLDYNKQKYLCMYMCSSYMWKQHMGSDV